MLQARRVQRDKLLEHVFGVAKKAQENLEKMVGVKPEDESGLLALPHHLGMDVIDGWLPTLCFHRRLCFLFQPVAHRIVFLKKYQQPWQSSRGRTLRLKRRSYPEVSGHAKLGCGLGSEY